MVIGGIMTQRNTHETEGLDTESSCLKVWKNRGDPLIGADLLLILFIVMKRNFSTPRQREAEGSFTILYSPPQK